MRLYISSDIEGTCGITNWAETEKNTPDYAEFSERMTNEVAAACRGALELGYDVVVKDAHDSARNIIAEKLPQGVQLIRGWDGGILSMMAGLDELNIDAVAFTGYHSGAFMYGNPLAHTMTTSLNYVKINGKNVNEFVMNAYIAAYCDLPVVFASGDEAMCKEAKKYVPDIVTVASVRGMGSATISEHPTTVQNNIYNGVKMALSGDINKCRLELPDSFELEVCYKELRSAISAACFKGAERIGTHTVLFKTNDYSDILRFNKFCM